MASSDDVRYQSRFFLSAVVPLLRHIIEGTPKLGKLFAGQTGVVQISCLVPGEDKQATHLIVEDGEVSVKLGTHPAPSVEIEFGSREKLNAFFTGDLALPKIHGWFANTRLLVATVASLLTMSSLLGAEEPPEAPKDQELLSKCMFYLLSTGISQLNKEGHPKVQKWANQPDRVYAWVIKDRPDLGAYIRVKAGKSKAMRGEYTRSKPFFAMAFDSPRSALGILLETDDMLESTASGKLEMQGAPEYGAELGDLMMLVGGYAK